jgi:hypothetical protein
MELAATRWNDSSMKITNPCMAKYESLFLLNCSALDITTYAYGIVGRGVLLDIPRLKGVKWIEPSEAVTRKELEEAEKVSDSAKVTSSSSGRDIIDAGSHPMGKT